MRESGHRKTTKAPFKRSVHIPFFKLLRGTLSSPDFPSSHCPHRRIFEEVLEGGRAQVSTTEMSEGISVLMPAKSAAVKHPCTTDITRTSPSVCSLGALRCFRVSSRCLGCPWMNRKFWMKTWHNEIVKNYCNSTLLVNYGTLGLQ